VIGVTKVEIAGPFPSAGWLRNHVHGALR